MESAPFFDIAQSLAESIKAVFTEGLSRNSVPPPLAEKVDAVLTEVHHNSDCVATETNVPAEALKNFKIFSAMML